MWWLVARVSNFSEPYSWVKQYLTAVHRPFNFSPTGSMYAYELSLLWGYSVRCAGNCAIVDGGTLGCDCALMLLFQKTLSNVGFLGYLPTTTIESVFFSCMTLMSVSENA